MRFAHDLRYDASPADVHRMLADPAFRDQVCVAMHATRHEVSVDPAAGGQTGLVVVVDQTQPARGIPSFARRFVGDEIRIVQRETWTGTTAAALGIEIPGKPGRLDGTVTLAGDGAGTLESVTGEVRVKVPMIGGKLESLVADLLRAALQTEERVGRRWLTGER